MKVKNRESGSAWFSGTVHSRTVRVLITLTFLTVGCGRSTSATEIKPDSSLTPTAPVVEAALTHPELEIITPENVDRLEQIEQWGQGTVYGIALSPDGNMIAVATASGVYLYERATSNQVGFIDIRTGVDIEVGECTARRNLAFSPDGATLAIAGTDITLWDLATGTVRTVIANKIEDPASVISEIQFSPDGSRIAGIQKVRFGYPCYLGWGSAVIYAVDNATLISRQDYQRYEEPPTTIYFDRAGIAHFSFHEYQSGQTYLQVDSSTGRVLVRRNPSPTLSSISETGGVRYEWIRTDDAGGGYDLAHLVDLRTLEDVESLPGRVVLIPNSESLLVLNDQLLTVRTLDGTVVCSAPLDDERTTAFLPASFSSDGTIGLSWNDYGNRAGDVRIWDLEQCSVSEPILILPQAARQMSISPDGRSVLTGSVAGYSFHVFDTQTGRLRTSLSGYDTQFSADGRQALVVTSESIDAHDVETGEYQYRVLDVENDYMTRLAVSPDGHTIAMIDSSLGRVQILDLRSGSQAIFIPGLVDYRSPHFNWDGSILAMFDKIEGGEKFRFWDLRTGDLLVTWNGLLPYYRGFTIAPSFTRLAALVNESTRSYVHLWSLPSFTLDKILPTDYSFEQMIFGPLVFSPDESLLIAYGDNPDELLFWNVETGELVYKLPTSTEGLELGYLVAFSPDGRLLLTLGGDRSIHVWGVRKP